MGERERGDGGRGRGKSHDTLLKTKGGEKIMFAAKWVKKQKVRASRRKDKCWSEKHGRREIGGKDKSLKVERYRLLFPVVE